MSNRIPAIVYKRDNAGGHIADMSKSETLCGKPFTQIFEHIQLSEVTCLRCLQLYCGHKRGEKFR